MYYTVYKTTNKINGKCYIGCHKTNNLNDDYIGSGTLLKRAIKKYGLKNFTKEIIETYLNSEDMFLREKEFITELKPQYNLHEGGKGGWEWVNKTVDRKLKSKAGKKSLKNKSGIHNPIYKNMYRIWGKLGGSIQKNTYHLGFLGKKHTKLTKQKIGKINSNYMLGPSNPMRNRIWITNGLENKILDKIEIIPHGWYKGRVLKKLIKE